jgi:hypothetical protein
LGVAASLLAGALALGAEDGQARVDVGVGIGRIETGDPWEWKTTVYSPYLRVSSFGEELSWSAAVVGAFTGTEDYTDHGEDWEGDVNGVTIGGLVGWGFRPHEQITVTPLAGLSYRRFVLSACRSEDYSAGGDFEYDLLTLDLGVRTACRLVESLELVGQFTIGPALAGGWDYDGNSGGGMSDDFDGGMALNLCVGLDWRMGDLMVASVGFAYERLEYELEGSESGQTIVAARLGVGFRF